MKPKAASDSIEDDERLFESEAKKSKRVATASFIALTFVLLASVFYSPSPADANGQYFTLCGFKAVTGLPCPGCGLTHSFCAIGKGDWREALAFNAVGPPLFLAAILVWLRFLFVLAGVKGPVEVFDRRVNHLKVVRLFAIALGLFGIVRIVYLVIWLPTGFQDSPLMHFMQRILA
jgi:uncharacterized protein DUF2752